MAETAFTFDSAVLNPDVLLRLALALALGGIVGLEREAKQKPAGLRTHMLVALAACTFVVVAFGMLGTLGALDAPEVRLDPIRVMEAVVAGAGFLAAGAIIQARGTVQGITTGATLWLAGAIGVACGAGFYLLAGAVVAMSLAVLVLLRMVERRWLEDRE